MSRAGLFKARCKLTKRPFPPINNYFEILGSAARATLPFNILVARSLSLDYICTSTQRSEIRDHKAESKRVRMARGNQRDKAREKTQKEAAASVIALHRPAPRSMPELA